MLLAAPTIATLAIRSKSFLLKEVDGVFVEAKWEAGLLEATRRVEDIKKWLEWAVAELLAHADPRVRVEVRFCGRVRIIVWEEIEGGVWQRQTLTIQDQHWEDTVEEMVHRLAEERGLSVVTVIE